MKNWNDNEPKEACNKFNDFFCHILQLQLIFIKMRTKQCIMYISRYS